MDCHSREVIAKAESHMREVGQLELNIDHMQRRFDEELTRISNEKTLQSTQQENELNTKNEMIEALKDEADTLKRDHQS